MNTFLLFEGPDEIAARVSRQRKPLTVEILRDQLGKIPGDALVEIDGIAVSQASYGIAPMKPGSGGKLEITFRPLKVEVNP